MPVSFNISNSLESLAAVFSEKESRQQRGVFEPLLIVTQVEGMNLWLKTQLAGHIGIAANIEFTTPNQLINKIFFAIGGRFQHPLPNQAVSWIIYSLLGDKEFYQHFKNISGYYYYSNKIDDIRRLGLAEKIADLFDQYQIYRPEMIEAWNKGNLYHEQDETEKWQQYLWLKAKAAGGEKFPDKTLQGKFIIEQLKNEDAVARLQQKIPEINLFGLSIITAYHAGLLHEISRAVQVNFYLLNPSTEYFWIEDRSPRELARMKRPIRELFNEGNELLADLGKVQKETFQSLFQYDDFLNAYDQAYCIEPTADTLLHTIQNDIYLSANNENRRPILPTMLQDGSVTIFNCYTEAREVESLYNYLVKLLEKEPQQIAAKDIIVLVTDINLYAPFIRAVFDNAPYAFRYRIADENFAGNDTLFEALNNILRLNEDNFTAEAVLSLLESSLIKDKFQITDAATIRNVVSAAGIRFGIENSRADETYLVSWKYGLQRIVYGLCMSGEEKVAIQGDTFYPIDIVEGLASAEIMRFVHFVQLLIFHIEARKRKRSIRDWTAFIRQAADDFLYADKMNNPDEQYALQEILADYSSASEIVSEQIPFNVYMASLKERLQVQSDSGIFIGNGITFCSLIPMRSIPHDVVCMLGMNNSSFPRKDKHVTFDLIHRYPKRGDRNRKDNDKNLFIETILSARKYLFISYIGRKADDNTVIPPSSVIDSLLGYIETGLNEEIDLYKNFVIQQPLHSHSRLYNSGNKMLYNYLLQKPGIIQYMDATHEETTEPITHIDWSDVKRFYKDNIKYFYNRILNIYYPETLSESIPEHEVFEMDNLSDSDMFKSLLSIPGNAMDEHIEREKMYGNIPLNNSGTALVQKTKKDLHEYEIAYKNLTGNNQASVFTSILNIGGKEITGTIENIFGNNIVHISKTKNCHSHLQQVFLDYLFAKAAGKNFNAYLINIGEQVHQLAAMDTQNAIEKITQLISLYQAGRAKMHPYVARHFGKYKDLNAYLKMITEQMKYNEYVSYQYEAGFFDEKKFALFQHIAQLFEEIEAD